MRVGVVLSGGFAKGAYQIGALRALQEMIPREDICCISAASIGVLNGYAYAVGALDTAEKMWHNICAPDVKRNVITNIMRGTLLQQNINWLDNAGREIGHPFYCTLFQWRKRHIAYKDLNRVTPGEVLPYLKASVAFPPYNPTVVIDGISYYDGGLVDNIPVAPLVKHELDYIICFCFDENNYQFENAAFNKKIIKIAFPATSMLSHSFVVTPAKIDEMIKDGYEYTKRKLGTYFYNGYEDVEYVYSTIEALNRVAPPPSLRLTVDVVASNLNRVSKKLTKRKIF